MQALTRPSKQEGGTWLKLVKSEATFFSRLVSNSSSSLTNSQTVSNKLQERDFFQNSPLTSQIKPAEVQCGKDTVQGTELARGGRFEKYIGSLRGNGPDARTNTVESNIERTQSCYKNSVICFN